MERTAYKGHRVYRSKSALEIGIKPGKPTFKDGKLVDWEGGIVFFNWFKREGMDQPLDKESKITVALSNNEVFNIINHFNRRSINEQASLVHNNKNSGEIKTVNFQWYQKDDNATPAFYINASTSKDNKISVSLTQEDIQFIGELNRVCIHETHVAK